MGGPHHDGVIALAGNPNAGKTALFNALTGSHYKVGNWPGVTVDKRSGFYRYEGKSYHVIDLPGTYSLSVISQEAAIDQKIACQYLLSPEIDFVINVVDGSNLERNLFLTLQLLELGIPVIVAVNMMDIVEKRGLCLDLKKLSKQLGVTVLDIVASQQKGIDGLRAAIAAMDQKKQQRPPVFELPLLSVVSDSVCQLTEMIAQRAVTQQSAVQTPPRWLAIRLLEGDLLAKEQAPADILTVVDQLVAQVVATVGEEPDILIADARHGLIDQIALSVTTVVKRRRHYLTEYIDRIVLNRYLGIPIFLLVMYLMFVFAINVGGAFQDFFDLGSTTLFVDGVAHYLTILHTPSWIVALLAQGVGKGVNTVITFIPVLAAMFFFLAFLEDCGYMVRAAFVMDRFMQMMGLPGKSFVPMIVGFGCNVPAVMGTRNLEGRRDRILTILMMPFMSCGARLAIFSVFVAAFFPTGGGYLVLLLYLLGIVAAVLTGLLLRKTLLPGKPAPLVMELPPYHLPALLPICRHTWSRLKKFITRAGYMIVPVCVIIGGLNAVTATGKFIPAGSGGQHSLLSDLGRVVTPVLSPMGVKAQNWPATVGLVTGILAKEVVIGTLNTLYSQTAARQVGGSDPGAAAAGHRHFSLLSGLGQAWQTIPANLLGLISALKNPWLANEAPHEMSHGAYGVMYQRFGGSKAAAFAYLVFVLLYFPCVSTMAVTRRELNRAWALLSVGWNTTVAYAAAVITYQATILGQHPLTACLWIASMLSYVLIVILVMRFFHQRLIRSQPGVPPRSINWVVESRPGGAP